MFTKPISVPVTEETLFLTFERGFMGWHAFRFDSGLWMITDSEEKEIVQ